MVSQRRKNILNLYYGIKSIGGQQYEKGFYDALDWFDKRVRVYLREKQQIIEFAEFIANKKEDKRFFGDVK